jgi:hypothetical protein
VDDYTAAQQAAVCGVETKALSSYRLANGGRPGLVLGYAGYPEDEIRAGIVRLARAVAPHALPHVQPGLTTVPYASTMPPHPSEVRQPYRQCHNHEVQKQIECRDAHRLALQRASPRQRARIGLCARIELL